MSDWTAVVGTLGGAGVGFAGSFLVERWRWKRDQSTRWHDTRRVLYADLVAAFEAMWNAADDLVSTRGGVTDGPMTPASERAFLVLMKALDGMNIAIAEVEMLAGDEVLAALGPIRAALRSENEAAFTVEGGSATWDEARTAHGKARSHFIAACRMDLGAL